MIKDIKLAFKYFIEGNPLTHLSIPGYTFDCHIIYHIVLLLYTNKHLTTPNLYGSMGTLTNPKAMLLFCEALKYSNNLLRLCVGNCGIDNRLLQGLASAITEGCRVQTLYIENNPYTAAGLSQFLQTLVFGVEYTFLAVLSVDTDSFQRTSFLN